MGVFTKYPTDAFQHLQINAGVIVKTFTPETRAIGDILGATSGGVKFTATPTYSDYGEDIDNFPKNMKELKRLDFWEAVLEGTMISVSKETAKSLVGAGDLSGIKITPREELKDEDFEDIWLVGDYSEVNTGSKAGFIAIHLMNALSTGGFSIQTGDKAKGQFAFSYTAHYSMEEEGVVPFEIYVQQGEAA